MTSLYDAVSAVLGDFNVVINGTDYAPLVVAVTAGIALIVTILNVFAFLRFLAK